MSTVLSRLYNFVTDKANSIKITASRVDGEFDQLITAVNRKVLCSASAPSSPIAGQTWVDTTNKVLKLYRNNEWVIMGAVHVGTAAPSTVQEGDLWYDTTNNLLKSYNGSAWVQAGVTINGLTEKTALVGDDLFLIEDSEASNAQKKVKHSNIKGKILQIVNTQSGAYVNLGATTIPLDDTIPQITEGNAITALNTAITPASTNNKILVEVVVQLSHVYTYGELCLFNTDIHATNAIAVASIPYCGDAYTAEARLLYYGTAPVAAATTYQVRVGNHQASNWHLNGRSTVGARDFGGVLISSMTITEIAA